jgi:hypothetical protein
LMLMATISLLGPPIGRWVLLAVNAFFALPSMGTGGPPPVSAAYVPHMLSYTLMAVGMARDRQSLGRIHPAYLAGLAIMVVQLITLEPISVSQIWQEVAGHLAAMHR